MPSLAEPLLTTEEVAELLHVHPKHVYRLLKRGLPARRVGSEWRFERSEVLRWSLQPPGAAPAPPIEIRPAGEEPAAAAPSAPPPLITANGDLAVTILLRQLQASGLYVGFIPSDRAFGIRLLEEGRVLAAGCHAGGFPTYVGESRVARIHLVTREVGLAGRLGAKPPKLRDLQKARFASRPPSAGVRVHLDRALEREGLDPAAINQKAQMFDSHLDVACAVASGKVEFGLVSRAWSARLGLPFLLLEREAYGLIVRARDLGDPRIIRISEVAQSARYRDALAEVAGYDPAGAGDIKYDA